MGGRELPSPWETYLGSVSALSFTRNSPKFYARRVSRVNALTCRISTPRQGVRDISIRRGSGLFISCRAFGDASCKIN